MATMKAADVSNQRTAVSKPLYGQVREIILGRIGRGEWGPGDSLPNEFILANQFEVSVGTIRRAIEGLEESGIVVRKQGRGTYVSGQGAQALQNKFTLVRSPGGRLFQLTYKLIGTKRREAVTSDKVRFVDNDLAEVIEVRQTVHSATRMIGFEHSIIPANLLPDLESSLGAGQHLYPIFSDQGVLVTRAEERIRSVTASAEALSILAINAGAATMVVERVTYALEASPIEIRTSTFVGAEVSWVTSV